jgi:hypothetical protein
MMNGEQRDRGKIYFSRLNDGVGRKSEPGLGGWMGLGGKGMGCLDGGVKISFVFQVSFNYA